MRRCARSAPLHPSRWAMPGGVAGHDRRVLDGRRHARVDGARERRRPGQLAAARGEVLGVTVLVRVELAVGVALKLVVVEPWAGKGRAGRHRDPLGQQLA